jgi:monoamine oxidase
MAANMTRREFLTLLAYLGGPTYGAMQRLGLLDSTPASSFRLVGRGTGQRLLILGAGLAGMTAAYEMGKLGYDCQILEARSRPGGRCWTVRNGTEERELQGETQVAQFDEGLYFNAGPARIAQNHVTLDYCRELGVPVEVFTNENAAAYFYGENVGPLSNRRVRLREVRYDLHGYTSELLAKAVRRDALDQALTSEDRANLIEYLRHEGDLSEDLSEQGLDAVLSYNSSSRRGYTVLPGAGLQPGTVSTPYSLSELLRSRFGNNFRFLHAFDQQPAMFQIVGGTDGLARAMEQRVKNRITYRAEVREVRKSPTGVRVLYRDRSGHLRQADGDFCVCTIPLSVLRYIPSDLSPAMQEAIRSIAYGPSTKIGLQMARRFWEEDDGIFGGITIAKMNITQIWYPSHGYLGRKGVLLGCYNFGEAALQMGRRPLQDRVQHCLREGAKIHPQYDREFETGFSVAWQNIEHSLGAWASYTEDDRKKYYPILNRPDERIYLAGEHVSYLTGWMAGALESARSVVTAIHERVLREPAGQRPRRLQKF